MAITVNTNMASIVAQRSLNTATNKMNTAMQRLSTGLKINSAKDDAAGSAVVTKLDYKVSSLAVAQNNAQIGMSMLQTTEGTLDVVQSNLERIRELTEQAANGTYGGDAMLAIKSEVQARLEEICRVSQSAEFNGKKILDGSCGDINLQVGIDHSESSIIKMNESLFASVASGDILALKDDRNYQPNLDGAKIFAIDDGNDGSIERYVAKVGGDYFNVSAEYVAATTGTDAGDPDDDTPPSLKAAFFGKDATDLSYEALDKASDADIKVIKENAAGVLDCTEEMQKYAESEAAVNKPITTNVVALQNTGASMAAFAANNDIKMESGAGEVKSIETMLSWVYANDSTAQAFLDNIDHALANVIDRKTELGASMQRINSAMDVDKTMENNLIEASSLIKDADIAQESSNYIKQQILQQTATSLLSSANQLPQIALKLLG